MIVGQETAMLPVCASEGFLDSLFLSCHTFFLSPSLWETTQYRLKCVQQASCLEGGPLLWIWPLYLHVNQKSDDDDDEYCLKESLNPKEPIKSFGISEFF